MRSLDVLIKSAAVTGPPELKVVSDEVAFLQRLARRRNRSVGQNDHQRLSYVSRKVRERHVTQLGWGGLLRRRLDERRGV